MDVQRRIENASLFVLIGLVALRPLIGESYDSAGSAVTDALGVVSDPKPLATLIFDVLILASSCGWLLARMIGSPRSYRRTGLEWGTALVAVAGIVSCLVAGNKRLAINATIDWLCLPLLAIALVQLLRAPWQRKLLLAAVLASACVTAAQCMEQCFSFNETWTHYQSIKTDFWARQGVELDSSKVELFEKRMQAREATGFLPHSNVAGSYLVLCGLAGIGLTAAQWRRWGTGAKNLIAALCTIGTASVLVAVALTKSLGAAVSGVAGLALWIVLRRFREWIDANRVRTWIIAWLCVVAGAGAVGGYGLLRGSLPGWSLTFRWQYWQASSKLIADHWATGVGRENFGRHYLRYKAIESPEEVANPHDLFVQAAADWGLLGLVGIVVMALGASYRFAVGPPARSPPGAEEAAFPTRSTMMLWTVGLLLVVTVGRLPLLGTADPNFLYYSTVVTGVVWLLGFIVFMARLSGEPVVRTSRGEGRVARAEARGSEIVTAVALGLFAFLLQDTINFAMFVPGSDTTFFALLGYCLASRGAPGDRSVMGEPSARLDVMPTSVVPPLVGGAVALAARRARGGATIWLALATGLGAMGLVLWLGVIPVALSQYHLDRAQRAVAVGLGGLINEHAASRSYDAASTSDPFDPTPEVARAQWLVGLVGTSPGQEAVLKRRAVKAISAAVKRDPLNVQLYRMRSRLYLDLAEGTQTKDAYIYLATIQDARRALELYPLNPAGIVALADVQAAAGEALGSEKLMREALASYGEAIRLDDRRLPWETFHRLGTKARDEIRAKIRRVEERLGQP